MAAEPSTIEQAVSRTLRDNLERLQRTSEELHQAITDLVSACASSRPANALSPMIRAQTSAASLAATLEVLSRFVTAALQQPAPQPLFEQGIPPAASLVNPDLSSAVMQPETEPPHRIEKDPWAAPVEELPIAEEMPAAAEMPPVAEPVLFSEPVTVFAHEATPEVEAPIALPVLLQGEPALAEPVIAVPAAPQSEPAEAEAPIAVPVLPQTEPVVEPAIAVPDVPQSELAEAEPPIAVPVLLRSEPVVEPVVAAPAVPQSESAVAEAPIAVPVLLQGEPAVEDPAIAIPAVPQSEPAEAEHVFRLDSLPQEEQELHRRAYRVAKVSMQDIKMLRPVDVQLGRENRDLCSRLRDEIEKAHREYARRFQSIHSHPVDYFYDWMVEILAGGDPQALGEYPYPSPVLRR